MTQGQINGHPVAQTNGALGAILRRRAARAAPAPPVSVDRQSLLNWLLPYSEPDTVSLMYQKAEKPGPGWLIRRSDVDRAVAAYRLGTLALERFTSINNEGKEYPIVSPSRLGLVLHRDGLVGRMCLDFDDHGTGGSNVHLADAVDRFLGAISVKFRSHGGKGLHCFFALNPQLPVAMFKKWAKSWGFNGAGDVECFPKSEKKSQVWLPNDPKENGGDKYQSGTFDGCILTKLPTPPTRRLSKSTLDFMRGLVPLGTRNDALNKAAHDCGRKGIAEAEARELCIRGADLCGLLVDEPDKSQATFESGFTAGKTASVPQSGDDSEDALPVIHITEREHECVGATVAALADHPGIYQRGGELVHIINEARKEGSIRSEPGPLIAPLAKPTLRTWISEVARLKLTGRRYGFPSWLVDAIHVAGSWPGIRQLESVVEVPILRPDGSLCQTPGYDEVTGVVYRPRGPMPAIPDAPTIDDLQRSLAVLTDLVVDFPFATEVHRAAWLAALLTPLARFAFEGPAPLMLVDANTAGTGKGLLLKVTGTIVTGSVFPVATYSHSDSEMRKVITSVALAGDQCMQLDNVVGDFGVPSLDAALTTTMWKDRLMTTNSMPSLPLLATWYATANNVCLVGDVFRRVCHIRLESPHERPDERTGFQHPNLLSYCQRERATLLAAALTILRGWFAASRPTFGLRPWGAYEGWSGVVRECVVWAGLHDPGETRHEIAETAGDEAAAHRRLLAGWEEVDPQRQGMTVAAAIARLAAHPSQYQTLRDEFLAWGTREGKLDAKRIGEKLRSYRRKIVGMVHFESRPDLARSGSKIWYVGVLTTAGSAGSAGSSVSAAP